MKKADHSVLCSNFTHNFHRKLVVVAGNVCRTENRRKFVLSRCNFIVFCFCKNSELPQFVVQVFHKCLNARLNHTEVMIFKFLTFRRFCAEQRASRKNKVFALVINALVYKEVFLLRTYSSFYAGNILVSEQMKNAQSLLVDCLHRAEKRSLFVQSLACI